MLAAFPSITIIREYKSYLIYISLMFLSCGSRDGVFGHSKTKEEAKANGSPVVEYLANKNKFTLLDSSTVEIDTAWTELSFTYKDDQRILDSTNGYHFSIPFKSTTNDFTFSLKLADSTNIAFTNGMDVDLTQLCPKVLYDTMKVLLVQKNANYSIGWKDPVITDTIMFTKIF